MQTPKIKCCIKLENCKIQTLTPVVSEFWTWLYAWKEKFFIGQHLFSRWQGRVTLCHKGCWKRANNTRLMTSASRFCNSSILSCHTAVSLDSSMTEDSFKIKKHKNKDIPHFFALNFAAAGRITSSHVWNTVYNGDDMNTENRGDVPGPVHHDL